MKKIGVGIIGASPERGWAVWAHIPALRALPQYEIRAVSTSRRESAEAAQRTFQMDAYDNPEDLIRHNGVDLVVVCVKVPNHYSLGLAALNAGKMVYCEWPLGVNSTQAQELESRAKQIGVRTVVGLQGRFSPQIQEARRLIQDGYVGDVLSTTLVSSGTAWGGRTPRSNAYLFDEDNGANVLTVPALHAIDTLAFVAGEFETIQARSALRTPFVEVLEDGARVPVTAPDQVSVTGRLKGGALGSVFVRGGVSRAGNLYWQINGSQRDLAFTSDSGNIQVADLRLHGGRGAAKEVVEIAVRDELGEQIPPLRSGFASNIVRLNVQFANDLEHNTRVAPDFSYAVGRHGLLDRIRLASNEPGVGAAAAGGLSKSGRAAASGHSMRQVAAPSWETSHPPTAPSWADYWGDRGRGTGLCRSKPFHQTIRKAGRPHARAVTQGGIEALNVASTRSRPPERKSLETAHLL